MTNCLQPATRARMKSASLIRVKPLRQQGLTLVELMVAMAISLLITLAAVAALIVSAKGSPRLMLARNCATTVALPLICCSAWGGRQAT